MLEPYTLYVLIFMFHVFLDEWLGTMSPTDAVDLTIMVNHALDDLFDEWLGTMSPTDAVDLTMMVNHRRYAL
jgi:hypothetical protein